MLLLTIKSHALLKTGRSILLSLQMFLPKRILAILLNWFQFVAASSKNLENILLKSTLGIRKKEKTFTIS